MRNLKLLILMILFPIHTNSCTNSSSEKTEKTKSQKPEKSKNENEWNYKEVKQEHFVSLMTDICATIDMEFIDLHPNTDSITSDEYENIILVDSLKAKGFAQTNWSRGNWQEGPRIISITMSNKQCECKVDKLYYSTKKNNHYKVTERIKCESLD